MDIWFAGCAALAIDMVPELIGVRPGSWWAQSATVEVGHVRVSVVDDYRDGLVYLEAAGLADPGGAVASLTDRGFHVGHDASVFVAPDELVVAAKVHHDGRRGADSMVEVGHFLWCVGKLAHATELVGGELLPEVARAPGAVALARAAGRAYRPWRLSPRPAVLRVPTARGNLTVFAQLRGSARWLAYVAATAPLPSDPQHGPAWFPVLSRGQGAGQLALVGSEPTSSTVGNPVPSLGQLLALLDDLPDGTAGT